MVSFTQGASANCTSRMAEPPSHVHGHGVCCGQSRMGWGKVRGSGAFIANKPFIFTFMSTLMSKKQGYRLRTQTVENGGQFTIIFVLSSLHSLGNCVYHPWVFVFFFTFHHF